MRVERAQRYPDQVVIDPQVPAAAAACPRCGQVPGRVHGGNVRRLRDAAVGGVQVVIALRLRRFSCGNTAACPAVTFAEQVDSLTSLHSRFTSFAARVLTQIGLALAGHAGLRLAAAAGVALGGDINRQSDVPGAPPKLVGEDAARAVPGLAGPGLAGM